VIEAGETSYGAAGGALTAERSGFWRRFAATVIDGALLDIVTWILILVVHDAGYVLGLLVTIGYYTYFHGSTGQTPGDAALSIRVVDLRDDTGKPIGYGRAFVRWLVSIVSGVVFLIGYLWMLWDPEKQTWHDKAAGSVVVPASS
jgi:uncharacterized RDD family membrane protein YckC